ncbi:hypothetical protein ACPOL_3308 [Acidisarcina polymorpha]|uniref:Uncharacterized protein n=1 Tax=Acidisarcina polymorpha TaxID=2211140 RepID=A0A2Z5G0N1_9BACT|nr:hypothetical protein ACPOL_3308 [Acidisarcina polymorpha]
MVLKGELVLTAPGSNATAGIVANSHRLFGHLAGKSTNRPLA